jgi:hypothetical protein
MLMAVLLAVAGRAPVPLPTPLSPRDFTRPFARGGRRRSIRRGAGGRPER